MKTIYRLRGWLMVPPMIFVMLCIWNETENKWLLGGGGVIFALGVALRVWAQMHLHYRLKVKKTLTVTGPFAYVRNPTYIANTAMLAGACMLGEIFWFVPIQVLYCAVVYTLVVRYEEAHLARKYGGAYQEYAGQVPRWLPKLKLLDKRMNSMAKYFIPSLSAEVHCLLFILPFLAKEMIVH